MKSTVFITTLLYTFLFKASCIEINLGPHLGIYAFSESIIIIKMTSVLD